MILKHNAMHYAMTEPTFDTCINDIPDINRRLSSFTLINTQLQRAIQIRKMIEAIPRINKAIHDIGHSVIRLVKAECLSS